MRGAHTVVASVLVLASFAYAAGPTATVGSLPGSVQPNPGTRPGPSRRGSVVAFTASYRENPGVPDSYFPFEIPTVFLWDRNFGTLRQLTDLGPCDQPSAENGTFLLRVGTSRDETLHSRTLVAFRSTADLVTGSNPDNLSQIFVWDSDSGEFTQISNANSGSCSDPAIGARFSAETDSLGNFTGNILVRFRVAFLSTANLTGDNPSGRPQVFQYDSGLSPLERLVQVTHATSGSAGRPAVDGGGAHVAFVHDGVLLPGDGSPEVYVWDRSRGLRRATSTAGTGAGADEPTFDGTGHRVAWSGGGPNEDSSARSGQGPRAYTSPQNIMVADYRTGRLTTFRPSTGVHRSPSLMRGSHSLVCLSTDPGNGGETVSERPVELRAGSGLLETGLSGGGYGSPFVLSGTGRTFFVTSTNNLDGTNSARRNVLFLVRYRP